MSRRSRQEPPIVEGSLRWWAQRHIKAMEVKGYSEWTLKNRKRHLRMFADWAEERGIDEPLIVSRSMLQAYQRRVFESRTRKGDRISFSTQHARLVSVRQLFGWLTKQGVLAADPASGLELPKVKSRLPRGILSPEDAARVLAQPDTSTRVGIRDRALLELIYTTAIRRSEMIGLEIFDLDMGRRTLHVRDGKGGKDRIVPVGEDALEWVSRYLDDVRPRWVVPPDDRVLFLTPQGRPISPNRASKLGRAYLEAAGVHVEGSALHIWRHAAATAMLEAGADVRVIQELLGHATLSTTQLYTRVSIKHLREVHRKTHPRG